MAIPAMCGTVVFEYSRLTCGVQVNDLPCTDVAAMTSKSERRWSPSKKKINLDYYYTLETHVDLALCNYASYTDV